MPLKLIDEARNREEGSVKDKSGKKKPGSPKLGPGMGRAPRAGLAGAIKRIKARAGEARRDIAKGEKFKALTGGQAKLDKNKNNKIDAEDFKMLRAGKRMGGVMKARVGKMFTKEQKKKYPGLAKAGSASEFLKRRKELTGHGKMTFDQKMKAQEQGLINKKTGAGYKDLMKRASSVGLGKKLLIPVAAGVATVQYLRGKLKKNKEKNKKTLKDFREQKKPGEPSKATQTKNQALNKLNKKMGGGMMKKYAEGGLTAPEQARRKAASPSLGQMARKLGQKGEGKEDSSRTLAKFMKSKVDALNESVAAGGMKRERVTQGSRMRRKEDFIKDVAEGKYKKPSKDAAYYKSIGLTGERGDRAVKKFFAPKDYNVGCSVTVKTKLGRNKPTKMY